MIAAAFPWLTARLWPWRQTRQHFPFRFGIFFPAPLPKKEGGFECLLLYIKSPSLSTREIYGRKESINGYCCGANQEALCPLPGHGRHEKVSSDNVATSFRPLQP